jgi:DNA-binding NtrC family response regulator
MLDDTTASFTELAKGLQTASAGLAAGFVCGSPFHGLPRLPFSGIDSVEIRRGKTTQAVRAHRLLTVEVNDRWASSPHLRLVKRDGDWQLDDMGAKNGCYVNGTRVQSCELMDGDLIELGTSFLVFRESIPSLPADAAALPETHSQLLRGIYEELRSVADSELPVLITGQTGSGKEIAAGLVHRLSQRAGPLYPVNCAAIPAAVSESFLFGHKKGAFSGAVADHEGVIRAAHGGTLFLDEVAELDLLVQAKLLRVLQDRSVTPVGGTRAMPVDVRVISATHADLDALVRQGRFRQDLLARLSGHRAELPSLAERREDLGLLVEDLLERRLPGDAQRTTFDRGAIRALYAYRWPNNVRELDQVLHRCALNGASTVTLDRFPSELREATFAVEQSVGVSSAEASLCEELTALLKKHRGNVSAVARDMGKARVQIRRWCRRFQLDLPTFRDG